MHDAEITIVGGGPVGLLVALLCAEADIEVALFETRPQIAEDLRATSFHPPTLDLLDTIGLAQPLVDSGMVCPNWQIRMHPSGERALFEVATIADATRHPFRLQCEQWRLSEALLSRLQNHARVSLHLGTPVTEIETDESSVVVRYAAPDAAGHVRTPIVVGADGLSSTVRTGAGIAFEGQILPETTLVVTTPFRFEDHLDDLSLVTSCWTRQSHVAFLRLPGFWRLALYPDETRPIEEQADPQSVEAILQDLVPQPEPFEKTRIWPYRVQQRCAAVFRSGRVALAGDAAHVNSPAGGLGLNTGIHDAFALAEALVDILRHKAPLDRLDTYDRQRRSIATAILKQALANRDRMRQTSFEDRRRSLAELQATAADPDRHRAFVLRASMIEALRKHDPDRLVV